MCVFVSLVLILVSYFVGSIPTGYWFSKYFFNIDITKAGSGNIGATNIGRILGKKYFALIFLIDFLKAFLALYFLSFICNAELFLILNSMALLIGNAYSIFLKFNGGKGVATTVGILAALFPLKLLFFFICMWLLGLAISHRPFIASLAAIYLSCFAFYFLQGSLFLFYLLIFICFWLTFRHKSNLKQLISI